MYRALVLSVLAASVPIWAAPQPASLRRPLVFEPNRGQAPAAVKWLAHGDGYQVFFTEQGVTIKIAEQSGKPSDAGASQSRSLASLPASKAKLKFSVLQMKLAGSQPWTNITGLDATGGVSNYIRGKNAEQSIDKIPHYARLKAAGIYKGVDLVFYSVDGKLEYDFDIAPGADPKQIQLLFEGQDQMQLEGKSGDLLLTTHGGSQLRQLRPRIYQQAKDQAAERKVDVAGGYRMLSGGRVDFKLAAYDNRRPLVIDPTIAFSLVLAGNYDEATKAVAVDASGNSYFTGWTMSQNFPLVNAFDTGNGCDTHVGFSIPAGFEACAGGGGENPLPGGRVDGFIVKLSPTGTILFSTYFGNDNNEEGMGIAVDAGGIYVTGTWGVWEGNKNPDSGDVLVMRLTVDGGQVYSKLFGGSRFDIGNAIALDSHHNAWVTGSTRSSDFPLKNGELNVYANGAEDAFVLEVNPSGDLVFSEPLAGSASDVGYGIAVDSSDNPWVVGGTCSNNFPVLAPTQSALGECSAFITRLVGGKRTFATRFGGSALADVATSIAVDASDTAYVTGYTHAPNFPTTHDAFQPRPSAGMQGFVTAFDSTGKIVHSTFLGGDGDTSGNSISLDTERDVYVAGGSFARNFPSMIGTPPAGPYGFVSRLSKGLTAVAHSNYLGDTLRGVAVQPAIANKLSAFFVAGSAGPHAYTGKLYEDGVRDSTLWHNETTGEVQAWHLNHKYDRTGVDTMAWLCGPNEGCPANWKMVGSGDFNGDGNGDILLHNVTTGEVQVWLLNGSGGVIGTQSMTQRCDTASGCAVSSSIVGVGDFNGDAHADILWQNIATGEVYAWLLDGRAEVLSHLTFVWKCGPNEKCPANWRIVGAGDLNQDGHDDVILHNVATGEVQGWLMNTSGGVIGTRTSSFNCNAASGCSSLWKFIGLGDFNNDGLVDMLWYDTANGVQAAQMMDRASNVIYEIYLAQSCNAGNGCSTATWKPIGTMHDYRIVAP